VLRWKGEDVSAVCERIMFGWNRWTLVWCQRRLLSQRWRWCQKFSNVTLYRKTLDCNWRYYSAEKFFC